MTEAQPQSSIASELAARLGEIVMRWSAVEGCLAHLLATLVNADPLALSVITDGVTNATQAQSIRTLLYAQLHREAGIGEMLDHLTRAEDLRADRNALVHGLLGHDRLPERNLPRPFLQERPVRQLAGDQRRTRRADRPHQQVDRRVHRSWPKALDSRGAGAKQGRSSTTSSGRPPARETVGRRTRTGAAVDRNGPLRQCGRATINRAAARRIRKIERWRAFQRACWPGAC